ncbi:pentapeptide repeat-containing protein [Aeromonas caviae]|uniref:pentapeptide repeat-containing protein n=1 Tax=Aeromonas caviae TaxID=648 RepID=UPI0038D1C3B7
MSANNNMKEELNTDQYILLVSCAAKGDFSEWNSYVDECDIPIKLRGAKLDGLTMENARFINKNGKGADFNGANFDNSKLTGVDMSKCNFSEASMKNISAFSCKFSDSKFIGSNLDSSELQLCYFINSDIIKSSLKGVCFYNSNFYECDFTSSDLSGAKFYGGGRNIFLKYKTRFNLCGARFNDCKFTNETYFQFASVSRKTDFRTIDFESARYSPGLKQEIQYCNRRHHWIDWYRDESRTSTLLAKAFWGISDYGRSPKRVIASFFSISLIYAMLFYLFPSLTSAENDLTVIRSIYYSVVTMTTLGFGDIYANPESPIAQLLTVTQVMFGYVLLGALITVLSNLFTADGPPQGLIAHPPKRPGEVTFHNHRTEELSQEETKIQ